MKTIGFANKYYTLWEVSEPYREYVSEYDYYIKQDFTYIQNLSFDLETAKSKVKGEFKIDMTLKGTSSFATRSEKINECPDHIFAFGKYSGKEIKEVDDIAYIHWYYSETKNDVAKEVLLMNSYVEYENEIISKDHYNELIERKEYQYYMDSLEKGHHFENGNRIDLEVKKIDSFSFDSFYGTTFIVTFASKDKKLFKYMGSNPPQINGEFTPIKATIKHDNYEGQDETKLQRIKIK